MCKKSSNVRLAHNEENMHSHPPGSRSSSRVVVASYTSQFLIFTPELQILEKKMCTTSSTNSLVESASSQLTFSSSLLIMDDEDTEPPRLPHSLSFLFRSLGSVVQDHHDCSSYQLENRTFINYTPLLIISIA